MGCNYNVDLNNESLQFRFKLYAQTILSYKYNLTFSILDARMNVNFKN